MIINEIVRYINTSVITRKRPEFLSTMLERYKQVYLAQEGASKDVALHKKMKFSIKDFFGKCDQICRKL